VSFLSSTDRKIVSFLLYSSSAASTTAAVVSKTRKEHKDSIVG